MMKTKSRRPVFLSAAILMILLSTVLIGGTFASLDTVDYENTMPQGAPDGNYNVALKYHNGTEYVSMQDSAPLTTNTFWCPGRTEIMYLQLTNNEAFPVDCTLKLNVTESGFGETLTYAVIHKDLKSSPADHPNNWAQFYNDQSATHKGTLKGPLNSTEAPNVYELHNGKISLPKDAVYRLAVAIHMNEDASSEYANKTMKFDFSLQIDANFQPGAIDLTKLQ